jgi:hypothetical protein
MIQELLPHLPFSIGRIETGASNKSFKNVSAGDQDGLMMTRTKTLTLLHCNFLKPSDAHIFICSGSKSKTPHWCNEFGVAEKAYWSGDIQWAATVAGVSRWVWAASSLLHARLSIIFLQQQLETTEVDGMDPDTFKKEQRMLGISAAFKKEEVQNPVNAQM